MIQYIHQISWPVVIILCLTLGLAPFFPKPHLIEKLQWLFAGQLKKPIDWFDLLFHLWPWVLLLIKAVITLKAKN